MIRYYIDPDENNMKTLTRVLTRRSCLNTSPDSVEVVAHLCVLASFKCGRQEQCAHVRACVRERERERGRERERNMGLHVFLCSW